MANELGLNEHHQNIIVNYLRFAKFQRNQRLRSVSGCFEDAESSRLLEETYTADEVRNILNELCTLVKGEIETELINSAHTTVLLLRQMLSQAEQWHLRLQAEISELENRELIEKISQFEVEELHGSNVDKTPKSPVKAVKLEPIAEGKGQVQLLQMEINRLKDENGKLKARIKQIEKQTFGILEEKSRLEENLTYTAAELRDVKEKEKKDDNSEDVSLIIEEVSQVKMEMEKNLQHSVASQKKLEEDLTSTKHHLLEVQEQLELAEKELEKKFCETAAYKNMKKMLASKNEQIKEMRKKLAKYEPIMEG